MKGKNAVAFRMAWLAVLGPSPMYAATYYVSPTGSDLNAGTSATAPWSTVAKVDSTTFQPGDSILFQDGGTWNASLDATSSGTIAAPITYGAYGNASLGNPTFSGSDPVSNSAFTNLTGTTYQMTAATAINWVFDNHQFTHEAQDALTLAGSTNPTSATADLSYVEQTPESFYYNSATSQLYVNTGSTLTGHALTLATRVDAVYNNGQSNLIFNHLNVSETAQDNEGYGFRVQVGSNIQILNSTAYSTGKHAFAVIDATGFVGKNLLASGSQPDEGNGGVSAFVSYSDSTRQGDTSQWINTTYTNPNGPYPVFISHGNANAIGSVLLQNMVSLGGYGTGMVVYTTGPNEKVTIQGGQLYGGSVELDTSNSIINGLTVGGAGSSISINGTNDVVQNSVFNANNSQPEGGQYGAIIDGGTGNTIRFNTFASGTTYSPSVATINSTSNTKIYANIIDGTDGTPIAVYEAYNGAGVVSSGPNLFSTSPEFLTGDTDHFVWLTLQQWEALGNDTNSIIANPLFTDPTNGNFSLTTGSPAKGFYHATLDPSLATANALLGSPNSDGSYNAGANPIYGGIGPAIVVNSATGLVGSGIGITLFNSPSVQIVSGGKLTLAAPTNQSKRSVLVAGALTFNGSAGAWLGQLDLTSNDLVVHNGDLPTITSQIQSGYSAGGIRWTGQGIISSAAASLSLTTLGVLLNSDANGNPIYNTFDGLPVIDTDVLVKYTYYGDTNLDGIVDGSDYTRIDNGFHNHLTGWANGDLNYDGVIDGSDYTLIDNTYNTQGASLAAVVTTQIAATAVPEPVIVGLLPLGAMMLRRRRIKRT